MVLAKTLSALGRTFITAGLLIFLFVAYQLWGTSLSEARHQGKLDAQAKALFASSNTANAKPANGKPAADTAPEVAPPEGGAVARISIPKIGVEKTVVEGTGVSDLKKGPGHYLNTPLPGQPGNSAIAGHRTTYGAPFNRLDELKPGDPIIVRTKQGQFTYKVTSQKIVDPSDVSVLAPSKDNRLTLTTCHPKFSAAKRLILTAVLEDKPAAAPSTSAIPASTNPQAAKNPAAALSGADLSGTAQDKTPALMWGSITVLSALLIWLFARRYDRRWPTYILGSPIFFVLLFIFFENFSLLLPANA